MLALEIFDLKFLLALPSNFIGKTIIEFEAIRRTHFFPATNRDGRLSLRLDLQLLILLGRFRQLVLQVDLFLRFGGNGVALLKPTERRGCLESAHYF